MKPALSLRGISKTYATTVALDDVDLDLYPGELHALVGENGAGKSTLAGIAFGEIRADRGSVTAAGAVGLVHQHFELAGRHRVWQNVLLGREPRRGYWLDKAAARRHVAELAERNGFAIDPDARVEALPVGAQQRVELLRELDRKPAVLLLDEPTAALAPAEIGTFFAGVKRLTERGMAVLIVTHRLQEVMSYSSRVTVIRAGRIVGRLQTADTTADAVARAMIGGGIPPVSQRVATATQPCVALRNVTAGTGAGGVRGLTLDVRAGEIVGVAGVEGNGQSTLADAIVGLVPFSGTIEIPTDRAVIPQDRQREALVLDWSVADNATLGRQHRPELRRGPLLDSARAREQAETIVDRFDVRTPSLDVTMRSLSGGNQQKIVIGRALFDRPRFVLAYNPTRGIDVGASALVRSQLMDARNAGAAILLISFDLDEILGLADRTCVIYRGALSESVETARADRTAIGRQMAGQA